MPAAPVFSAELRAEQTTLAEPAEVDLFGRYSWGICSGTAPQVTLEARRPGGEFAPAGGVAIYRLGTGMTCTTPPGSPAPTPTPTPVPIPVPCMVDWSSVELAFVTRPTETTEYRLQVGPLTSKTVTITVANPSPEGEPCNEVTHSPVKPLLQAVPERTRITYGETVRVRGTFAYELCGGRLVHPQTLPGIESLRAGARFPDQPARRMISGPIREVDGGLVYEFAPLQTTYYRLHYFGEFGEFETRVEVAPRLELELEPGRARGRASVRLRAHASTALRGARVTLERRTASSGWEPLRTLTLDRTLSAVAQIAVNSSDAELRASVPSTLRHAPATSRSLLVPGS